MSPTSKVAQRVLYFRDTLYNAIALFHRLSEDKENIVNHTTILLT